MFIKESFNSLRSAIPSFVKPFLPKPVAISEVPQPKPLPAPKPAPAPAPVPVFAPAPKPVPAPAPKPVPVPVSKPVPAPAPKPAFLPAPKPAVIPLPAPLPPVIPVKLATLGNTILDKRKSIQVEPVARLVSEPTVLEKIAVTDSKLVPDTMSQLPMDYLPTRSPILTGLPPMTVPRTVPAYTPTTTTTSAPPRVIDNVIDNVSSWGSRILDNWGNSAKNIQLPTVQTQNEIKLNPMLMLLGVGLIFVLLKKK